jgi:hypothetical protein
MGLENTIINAISKQLKNPILDVLKEIKIERLLQQSNFVKKEGVPTATILLHFIYMLIINKTTSTFIKYSKDSFKKDVYYRALQNRKFQWRKLLMLISVKLISKVSTLHKGKRVKVLIIDDTTEDKRGSKIEGVCDKLWSNKSGRQIRGINMVSLTYNDGYSNFMLDFALKFNKDIKVNLENFKHQFYHTNQLDKRKKEGLKSKLKIAVAMVDRVIKADIKADYLLVDSWYSKPVFVKDIRLLGLNIISRIVNSTKIWNFEGKHKTLNRIYSILIKSKARKQGHYNSIRYTYCSTVVKHKTAGRVKIVFLKTKNNLIPILSTNIKLTDERIIEIYKKRWNIEQGYKELREHFGFGKEENRIYEALIARISLSLITYNIISYINRINHEPQTLGGLFKDLECELNSLVISMEYFIKILEGILANLDKKLQEENAGMILGMMISNLRLQIGNAMDFRCES